MTKTLGNTLYLKQRLCTLNIQSCNSIEDHMDEFNRIIFNHVNREIKFDDEDQILFLIMSLTISYEVLYDTLIYESGYISLK